MNIPLVLDASAAIRVVLEPRNHLPLIEQIQLATRVCAPTLLISETANTLWKYRKANVLTSAQCAGLHAEALTLITFWIDDHALFPEALQTAIDLTHPVYDAVYLVSARRQAAKLLTFDKSLYALCIGLNIEAQYCG